MLGWVVSLAGLLGWDLTASQPASPIFWLTLFLAIVARTLLQTGLFIIGHDAMHGVLWGERRVANDWLGSLALGLYAALPYQACSRNHQHHHQFTASAADPDFHGDPGAGAVAWYARFMAGYLTWGQMGRLLAGWTVLALIACSRTPVGWLNVLLFCTVPLLLSSLQLFVFGTYLPHRGQRSPQLRPNADSLELPPWLSLVACFHFGYHREHHDAPRLAWFELPAQRDRSRGRVSPRLASLPAEITQFT
jgi:beta-carotene ketolase (CrtW type)